MATAWDAGDQLHQLAKVTDAQNAAKNPPPALAEQRREREKAAKASKSKEKKKMKQEQERKKLGY